MPIKLDITIPNTEIRNLLSFFPRGIVAFDVETTGLSPLTDKIIEIAGVKINERGEVHSFQTLINPRIDIPKHTIEIHQITDLMVKSAPSLKWALLQFMEFSRGLPLLAHNAKFDIGFLLSSLYEEGIDFPKCEVYDSCRLGRKAIVQSQIDSYRLSSLAQKFNIPTEMLHRAASDAYVCLRVFSNSIEHMSKTTSNLDGIINCARILRIDPGLSDKMSFYVPEHLQGIIPKLSTKEVIEIKYDGGSMKREFRPVKPISFLPLPNGSILYALCVHSLTNKSFQMKKIMATRFLSKEELDKWEDYIKVKKENNNSSKNNSAFATSKTSTSISNSSVNCNSTNTNANINGEVNRSEPEDVLLNIDDEFCYSQNRDVD
ncbi:MAG: 3'-5' exonuclease [Oligoflexia bacterium]|nr:3'-5' exonuclease [Oligoflexia bacterium]